MASIKKYLFGNPPFAYLATHLAQDDDFIADAQRLLKLGQDEYLRLSAKIGKSDAFLGRRDLEVITSGVIGEGEESKKVASTIYKLANILHGVDMPVDKAMDALSKAVQEKTTSLKVEDRRILSERIRSLAAEPAALARQFKAKELVGELGAELDGFRLICDIRPIFDTPREGGARERIEGAMPITVLRLEYSKPDGESDVFEVRITEKQINALEAKFADARQKLKLIADLLASHHVPVPTIGAADAEAS